MVKAGSPMNDVGRTAAARLSPPGSDPPLPDAVEVRVEGLCKSFDGRLVLDRVNLEVRRGELVAIVGSSGSGKTTLLRHLTGHFAPDRGRVLLADHERAGSPLVDLAMLDRAEMEGLERHFAVVFQQNGLLSGTVFDDVALPLRLVQGLAEGAVRDRVANVLRAVGLDVNEVGSAGVDQLSGGMAKRVAIAAALALDPALILYDEPTAGLDPARSWQVQELIQAVHLRPTATQLPRTSLVVTHEKDLLDRLQPRIVMLEDGRVVFDGTYAAFRQSDLPAIQPYITATPAPHGPSDDRA
jgi:phospholipid/cholesterol/gamma-HCH transport system ATP-binding protein